MRAVVRESATTSGETSGEDGEEQSGRQELKAEDEQGGGADELLGLEKGAGSLSEPRNHERQQTESSHDGDDEADHRRPEADRAAGESQQPSRRRGTGLHPVQRGRHSQDEKLESGEDAEKGEHEAVDGEAD